jgi:hypothetical protein
MLTALAILVGVFIVWLIALKEAADAAEARGHEEYMKEWRARQAAYAEWKAHSGERLAAERAAIEATTRRMIEESNAEDTKRFAERFPRIPPPHYPSYDELRAVRHDPFEFPRDDKPLEPEGGADTLDPPDAD